MRHDNVKKKRKTRQKNGLELYQKSKRVSICQMVADCQSKTFTNAHNECKKSADFMGGKMFVFMSLVCV